MARNSNAAVDPHQLWATNVAPLVTAAREGARHAARTASRERARANRTTAWWRRRWVMVIATGLVAAGAAGGAYAVVARRRSAAPATSQAVPTELQPETGGPAAGTLKSTMAAGREKVAAGREKIVTGREKVADLARSMLHKIRREEPTGLDAPDPAGTAPSAGGVPGANGDNSRRDIPTTGTGYGPATHRAR